jgi:hypothetical protein
LDDQFANGSVKRTNLLVSDAVHVRGDACDVDRCLEVLGASRAKRSNYALYAWMESKYELRR